MAARRPSRPNRVDLGFLPRRRTTGVAGHGNLYPLDRRLKFQFDCRIVQLWICRPPDRCKSASLDAGSRHEGHHSDGQRRRPVYADRGRSDPRHIRCAHQQRQLPMVAGWFRWKSCHQPILHCLGCIGIAGEPCPELGPRRIHPDRQRDFRSNRRLRLQSAEFRLSNSRHAGHAGVRHT